MLGAILVLAFLAAAVWGVRLLDRGLARSRAGDAEPSRAAALQAAANGLGLRFEAEPPPERLADWSAFSLLGEADEGRCLNAVSGAYGGHEVLVFDRRWREVTKAPGARLLEGGPRAGREVVEYRYAQAFAARLKAEAPSLRISSSQAAAAPRVAPEPGGPPLFLTAAARDLLAARQGWTLECSGRALLLHTRGRFPPEQLTAFMNFGAELLEALEG